MSNELDHKEIAVACYSRCWELLGTTRSDAEDQELLGVALTSRFHWRIAGGLQEKAIADWMVSRVFAHLGGSQFAIDFAKASLNYDDGSFPSWLKGSLFEGMARAHSAAGDQLHKKEFVGKALSALESESDKEDADLIREQLADLR